MNTISKTSRLLVDHLQAPVVLDEATLTAARRGLMDYLAASWMGQNSPELKPLLEQFEQEGGIASAWLIGQARQVTASQAALFNGMQAHVLDADDVHADVRGHPSAVILSALFSVCTPGMSGARLLRAYVQGVELMARLGQAVGPEHYERGWHNTATLGGLAATAAVAVLLDLDRQQILQALAIAATQASGLRLMFGTPVKSLHAGLAARQAVQSVLWARSGMMGDSLADPFDPVRGFLAVYGSFHTLPQSPADAAVQATQVSGSLCSDWGQPWRITTPGLWFKRYPCCSAAAHLIDAARQLAARKAWSLTDIGRIELTFAPGTDKALMVNAPQTGEQGRFSAEYIALLALTGRSLGREWFDARPVEPAIATMFNRVHRQYAPLEALDPDQQYVPETYPQGRYVRIRVYDRQQQMNEAWCGVASGSPGRPYPTSALRDKLALATDVRRAAAIEQAIGTLYESDLSDLFAAAITPEPLRKKNDE